MSGLSSFDDCGMWTLSGDPNHAEDFYNLLPSFWGVDAIDQTPGTYDECKLYAWAMGLGRVHYELEHAGNQAFPDTAFELLTLHELDYQVAPPPNASIPARQAAVLAKQALPLGYTPANVVNTLRAILGADFLAFAKTSDLTTPTVYPASPGNGPGMFQDVRIPPKFLQLADPVTHTGTPQWVAYQALDTSSVPTATWTASTTYVTGSKLQPTSAHATGFYYEATTGGAATGTTEPAWPTQVGGSVTDGGVTWTCLAPIAPILHVNDLVVVQGENSAVAEQVAVLAVSTTPPAGSYAAPGYLYFQATFSKAHDIGATVMQGNVPYWWSTQRQVFVIAKTQGAGVVTKPNDREWRRKVDEFLARIARAVDTWAFVQTASVTAFGGTIGPLTVGSPLGCVPLGTFTFSNSN